MLKVIVNDDELTLWPSRNTQAGGERTTFPHPTKPATFVKSLYTPDKAWSGKLQLMPHDSPLNSFTNRKDALCTAN